MPVYDYKCQEHGVFHDLAAMDDHALPKECPHCKALSPRIIVIPPEILGMDPTSRKAIDINEAAANEPMHLKRDENIEHAHSNCCHGHHNHKRLIETGGVQTEMSQLRQQVLYTAEGNKIFPSQRPWMISH